MNDLDNFFLWFRNNPLPFGLGWIPFNSEVRKIENVTSVLWYRKDQFQIQLFVVPGDTIIPEHTHPNVDSFEVYAGGNITFSHSGKWVHAKRGDYLRVAHNEKHGGIFGPGGGVFFSVQHWLNGVKPHCVACDYEGVAMGEDHLAQVVNGDAYAKELLHIADACSEYKN